MDNNNSRDKEVEKKDKAAVPEDFFGDVTQITKIRPEDHPANILKSEGRREEKEDNNNDISELAEVSSEKEKSESESENEQIGGKTEEKKLVTAEERDDNDESSHRRQIKISCHKCAQKLDVTHLEPFAYFDCPACGSQLIVPKWFDNYLLEEPGGVGGMATVYRALDIALDREVAIKVLNPELGINKQNRELFLYEARTAATINHYAVVPIYTCGEFEDQPYMVMQYMYGGSLEDKLKTQIGFLPMKNIFQWIHDVAEGLDNARRHGIIHHDVKPGNIMLDADANAKIGDFGIAQALNDQKSETIYEITKGWLSPHYVSPEKVKNGREDFLGDIYSLGATFYHLITGVPPFDYDDTEKVIKIRLTEEPISPTKFRPDIPPQIEKLIMSMMHKDPDKRPNYREIVKTLKSLLNKKASSGKKSPSSSSSHKIVTKTNRNIGKAKSTTLEKKRKINDVFNKKVKRTNPLLKLSIHLITWGIIIGIWFFAWENGYLDNLKKRLTGHSSMSSDVPADYLPDATQAFKNLNLSRVKVISKKILNDPDNPIEARKQAGLYLCIASYLNNDKNAQDVCREVAERLLPSLENTEPYMAVILFLNNMSIKPKALSELLQNEDYLYVVGKLAILLRTLYSEANSPELIKYYQSFHAASSQTTPDFWGNVWRSRRQLWIWAIEKHTGDKSQLEPLFAKLIKIKKKIKVVREENINMTSSDNNTRTQGKPVRKRVSIPPDLLNKLTPQWFGQHRRYATKRPRPANFSFDDEAINTYLIDIPDQYIGKERNRLRFAKQAKEQICKLMMRIPYEDQQITLKNGKVLYGTVIANPNFISIKLKNGKRRRIQWNSIPAEQIIDILAYYANVREQAMASGQVSRQEQEYEVAKDYLLIALFADWYGKYDKAAKFARKAIEIYPAIAKQVKKYLL